jgi:hypothetical protein
VERLYAVSAECVVRLYAVSAECVVRLYEQWVCSNLHVR